jgi:hypothetical protein
MKRYFLMLAVAFALCGSAAASGTGGAPNLRPDTPEIRIAMGPTSAARIPGGTGQQAADSSCPAGHCPAAHNKRKHQSRNTH